MLPLRLTPLAPARGERAVIVGPGPTRNDQVDVACGLPAASRTAVAPPVTVAVYRVSETRLAVGSRVTTRVVALYVTVAGTVAPAASLRTTVVPLTPCTASLKVAVTFPVGDAL